MTQSPKPSRLWKRPRQRWLLGIPIGGFIALAAGAVAIVGFHGALEFTNRNEFCYGCHIGRDTIVEEYEASIHFNNRTGVSAQCADCHVPEPFFDKMIVKVKATADIYYQLMETVTLENFESERLRLAQHVWRDMAASNSRECRSCHDPASWNLEAQPIRVKTNHSKMLKQQMNCIDCHQGVAHKRPQIR
jgi:nitrate/TMAO reductase-like tetraheme cytochrome c subunit